jgi:hypothetical protein
MRLQEAWVEAGEVYRRERMAGSESQGTFVLL